MKTIKYNITHEYVIQKSKFISKIYQIKNEKDAEDILKNLKSEYKDATHICYAYIINNIKRFQDDGEPSGTAGMPILNVLEQQKLNLILAVVIRYFGGIKLGAGGLVRAYTNSVVEALTNQELGEIISGYSLTITFKYDNLKVIDNMFKDTSITKKEFSDNITYTFNITQDNYNKIVTNLKKYTLTAKKEDLLMVI